MRVGSPLLYEAVDGRRVGELAEQIRSQETLFNPLIYDGSLRLLIDGQHRMQVLGRLGIRWMPVYNVDYLGAEVRVKNWERVVLNVDSGSIVELVCDGQSERAKVRRGRVAGWRVVVRDASGAKLCIPHSDALDAARGLDKMCRRIEASGRTVFLEAGVDVGAGAGGRWCALRVEPVVGKEWVIKAARARELFPPQVNRHLVDLRPVGMDLALGKLRLAPDDAQAALRAHVAKLGARVERGTTHDGRFYEERVTRLERFEPIP